jgi:hypothetical protein
MSSAKPLREFKPMDCVPIDYGEVFDKRRPFPNQKGMARALEVYFPPEKKAEDSYDLETTGEIFQKLFGDDEVDPEHIEGPKRRTREGGSEWEPIKILLEGDGNSNKMKAASNTLLQLTTQVGQAHIATGVPLDLGTNTQPSDPRTQRNTKPRVYRPTPVRPVSTTGQTGPCW